MSEGINFKRLIPVFLILLGIFLMNVPRTFDETHYIDTSTSEVQKAIREVQKVAQNDQDRIMETSHYVYKNVIYRVTGRECYNQTASDVLQEKRGDCVSMTKVVSAMLIGMNIPTEIVEGCVFNPEGRTALRPFTIPENPFKSLSVSREGGPHGGQLHSWVRAYDGVRWWTIETTAGVAFSSKYESDYGYDEYGTVNPDNGRKLCELDNTDYARWCATY